MQPLLRLDQPADLTTARGLVEAAAGMNLGEPELVSHGYSNQVLVYKSEKLVARFPRNEAAVSHIQKEAVNLRQLGENKFTLHIPRLIYTASDPVWSLTTYLEGNTYPSSEIRGWNASLREDLGSRLATFLYSFHNTVAIPDHATGEKSLIDQFAEDYETCSHTELRDRARKEMETLRRMAGSNHATHAIYGDIHGANLIFSDTKELTGIIDFADIHCGSVYEEFRRIYILDDTVTFTAACQEYEKLSGRPFDTTLARQWAIAHELSVLCRHEKEPGYPSLPRAREHISRWLQ